MTPRQARVALGGFALLAAGVTCNALYLQTAMPRNGGIDKSWPSLPRSEPERRTGQARKPVQTAPAGKPRSIAALLKAEPANAKAALRASPGEADREAVRSIQRELARRGYGPLVADGIMRPAARAAIMAFEHDHRLPLTGEGTRALLKRLVFGAPVAAETAGALQVRSLHAEALVKEVQRLLIARGYRPGAIDGRLGPETVAAIRVFETDQGLVPKGRISAQIVTRLQDRADRKSVV